MKKLATILIGASLALTAAIAQQDDTQATPSQKKQKRHQQQQQQQQQQQAEPGQAGQNQQAQPGQEQQQNARTRRQQRRMQRGNQPNAPENAQQNERTRGMHQRRDQANQQGANSNENENSNNSAEQNKNRPEQANQHGQQASQPTTTEESTGNATQMNKNTTAQTSNQRRTAQAKPDAQTVQRIKQEHTSFHAQPKPQQVKSVTYQQNYRIANAEHWQGPQYVAFRDYRPIWHERTWWQAHYHNVVLIGGGYYYWANGFWYPAWGYDPAVSYYAYNGPIYSGSQSLPPDQVIANVQAALQDMGYYKGEVDGLLGPLTRDALTQYQTDHGLYTTAAIDEPTLDSLGMAG
jgi:hypothetical protein